MTRADHPTAPQPAPDDALVADSRERAVRALLRRPQLKRLWSAQLVGGVGDTLALLVLVLLALQAAVAEGSFGGGYRGVAFAVATVFGVRILATLLFGAVLLGPLTALTSQDGPLDRRWTMVGADGLRAALLIVAPLWIDWMPENALAVLLVTAFVAGVAERFWTVCRESAAPALLPAPPPEGATVRPLPDHMDALRRLSLRTGFVAIPLAAVALVVAALFNNLLGAGIDWFGQHQAALASYVAAGLFAASLSVLTFLELPGTRTPRARSPLEGLRRPKTGTGTDKGRTGAMPLLILSCAAVAAAVSAAVAVAVLHAKDLGGGPVLYGLFVAALTGGVVIGIRTAPALVPALSRRRLLALTIAFTGVALLAAGLVPDVTTVLLILALAGVGAGLSANIGHTLLDQEAEEYRRPRTTEHLHAVVRVCVALGAVIAPLVAAAIGPHRLESGKFVFAHGGAAFTLMLAGALLLPVAALVLAKVDDRSGVPLRKDLKDALLGGDDPEQGAAASGFFIALEGGDGAGKSTQAEALAEWIRAKGHEVVLTREPGATPVGKRLRSILLDVSSAGLSHRAEALLYAADRAEHIDTVVRPALERGAVVISDRYIDSSVAYQGAGRDLSPTEIARINRWATNGLVPHLTVLLDVAPETARERFTEAPDRLESEPAEFHARVRAGFLTLAAADAGRYLVVDAARSPRRSPRSSGTGSTRCCRCPRPRSRPRRRRGRRPRRKPAARPRKRPPARPRRSAWSVSARSSSPSCAPRRRSASAASWRRRSGARPNGRRRRPGAGPRKRARRPRRSGPGSSRRRRPAPRRRPAARPRRSAVASRPRRRRDCVPRPRRSAWRSSARPRRRSCGPRRPGGSPRRRLLRPRPPEEHDSEELRSQGCHGFRDRSGRGDRADAGGDTGRRGGRHDRAAPRAGRRAGPGPGFRRVGRRGDRRAAEAAGSASRRGRDRGAAAGARPGRLRFGRRDGGAASGPAGGRRGDRRAPAGARGRTGGPGSARVLPEGRPGHPSRRHRGPYAGDAPGRRRRGAAPPPVRLGRGDATGRPALAGGRTARTARRGAGRGPWTPRQGRPGALTPPADRPQEPGPGAPVDREVGRGGRR